MTDSLDEKISDELEFTRGYIYAGFALNKELTSDDLDHVLKEQALRLKSFILQREAELLDALTIERQEWPQAVNRDWIGGFNECVDELEARKAKLKTNEKPQIN